MASAGRRGSSVGGEGEPAGQKRSAPQESGLAAARAKKSKKKKGGDGHAHAAKGTHQGTKQRRIARERLPEFKKEDLKYAGEQAERRSVIRWFFRAMGSDARDDSTWTGAYGVAVEICNRMGIGSTCADSVRRVMRDVMDGLDVWAGSTRVRAIKLTAGDQAVIRDCLSSGFGLSQATATVCARRLVRIEKEITDGLLATPVLSATDSMADRLEEMASVSKEWVRVVSHRMDGDVHRRQTKKSGTIDTSAGWAVASLAQAEQQLYQLAAGAGDRRAKQWCDREGWNPIKLEQIFWWDERHRKVCLGCMSSYEWRFPVDPNDEHSYLAIEDGGILPEEMPRTSAKYLSEARKSLGVMMKRQADGSFTGHRALPFDYTSRKMLSLAAYRARVKHEVARVANLKGGIWAKAPKKNDILKTHHSSQTRVKELRGGRYEALYPGPVRAGRPVVRAGRKDTSEEFLHPRTEWEWRIRDVIAHSSTAAICVTDMMDHIIVEGDRLFAGTGFEDSWVIGHDALSVWWEKESLKYLHDIKGFGPTRYLCAQGKTNRDNRYYRGSLVGNRPELMPLDSHLNADHEYGLMWHVAITSDLKIDDPKKFKMGTPGEVSDSMDRTWEVFPTPERIVEDILRFPVALQRIKDVNGAVVPEMDNRKGRRKIRKQPHHPDCEDALAAREIKWEKLEAEAEAKASKV